MKIFSVNLKWNFLSFMSVCHHFCLLVVSWISENPAQIWLVYVHLVGIFQFFHLVSYSEILSPPWFSLLMNPMFGLLYFSFLVFQPCFFFLDSFLICCIRFLNSFSCLSIFSWNSVRNSSTVLWFLWTHSQPFLKFFTWIFFKSTL